MPAKIRPGRNFKMRIDFYGKSDIGKSRKTNEDYFLHEKIDVDEYLFIVADGMGGHQAGDVAARLGTLTFADRYKTFRRKRRGVIDSMVLSLNKANEVILKKATNDPQKTGMGTTFSACVVTDMTAHIVHVGDSRIYLIRNNEMKRLTTDQTFVSKMVEDGRISEEEAKDHPQKNILYMSLGARESFTPEIIGDFKLAVGDIFVMCSDGLNSMVSDEIIQEYSLSYPPQEAVERLIERANDNGGIDNITIQVLGVGSIRLSEDTDSFRKNKFQREMMLK
jgi:serine/threonine protein phosphatase PrpC